MTPDEFDCLAYIVVDPDAWYQHAVNTFGTDKAEAMKAAKVERWWQEYKTESAKPDYKTRAERETNPQLV